MDTMCLREGWDRLCRHTGQAADTAARYARARLQAARLKARIDGRLRAVGEMVYATHTGDPTDSDALQAALEEIDGLRRDLERQERLLRILRGGRVCAGCGALCGAGDRYCGSCGRPIERG